MKAVIIYKGKYGATAQYAKWCGEAVGLPVKTTDEISSKALIGYDYFILGTSVYIGKLQIRKWLLKNGCFLTGKKIFVFQVAGTPPGEVKKREAYNVQGIPPDILQNCDPFYLPGRLVMKKLSWLDRVLINMGAKMASQKDAKDIMLQDYDNVKKEHLGNLVQAVKNYRQAERHDIESGVLKAF